MNYPDHNTIWRFSRDNHTILMNVMKQLLRMAAKGNLLGFVLNAIDGTKIAADVSPGKGFTQKRLKKLLPHLDKITEELCGPPEPPPSDSDVNERIPEDIANPKKLAHLVKRLMKAQRKGQAVVLDAGVTKDIVKSTVHELASHEQGLSHYVDPEARMMKCDGDDKHGYNAEIAVDDKHGLIVAADVTDENNDRQQLAPMVEQALDNTGNNAATTVADGDYLSGSQLDKVEKLGAKVVVNDTSSKTADSKHYHISMFTYNTEEDHYICPHGTILPFRRKVAGRDGSTDRQYICSFHECPHKNKCTKGKKGRTILRAAYIDVLKKNRHNLQDDENKKLLNRRKTIVEPVFGHLKHNQAYRRWRVRGLAKVRSEWVLVCIAYNLKKMYRLWQAGVFTFQPECMKPAV
jgi:hypothetical protein